MFYTFLLRKQIEKRVERAEKKAKSLPTYEALSAAATKLRLEKQKAEEIQIQIREQRTQLSMCDSRLERANQRLESLSQDWISSFYLFFLYSSERLPVVF